ncbi:peptidyl-prolyl cis-trans isomerase E-like [Solenopsis invicta]|uniref:peptidyl-prolyl cis-trans isomerase E-like n=1 Tax=Solenopsis invicta TaxID=13686 RepID=UPI00193D457A|nr:peptidyl-prolyl cis-trans isomerase E-like [Solenopsis invicta]
MEESPSAIEKRSLILDVQKRLSEKSQTRCFFDIGLKEENQKLGRIIFELYDSIVPRTCENFAAFCHGVNGLSYKRTPFHRIVSGYWCQGGDVTKFDGTGGSSIYGDSFDKENSSLRHTGPGILSTCDNDDGKNDSKFNLTFKCLRTLDGDKTVFGRVIDGMNNIYKNTLITARVYYSPYICASKVKHTVYFARASIRVKVKEALLYGDAGGDKEIQQDTRGLMSFLSLHKTLHAKRTLLKTSITSCKEVRVRTTQNATTRQDSQWFLVGARRTMSESSFLRLYLPR